MKTYETDSDIPNSGIFLDSAYFSPESILPAQFLDGDSGIDNEPVNAHIQQTTEQDDEEEEPERTSSSIGLIASISVGIIIAFALFLVIRYTERSTRSYVTESWANEISRRVGHYEQIYGSQHTPLPHGETLPYNLALHAWQEVPWEVYITQTGQQSIDYMQLFPDHNRKTASLLTLYPVESQCIGDVSGNVLGLEGISDNILLLMPGREISVRLGFGEDILFRDGRIFSRVLPGVERP